MSGAGDNSKNMTVEQRLVQHLKTTGLSQLVNDDDALAELAKSAVYQAIFQPVRVPKQYGGWEDKDSLLVTEARPIAQELLRKILEPQIKEYLERPEVAKAIKEAVVLLIPDILRSLTAGYYSTAIHDMAFKSAEILKNLPR